MLGASRNLTFAANKQKGFTWNNFSSTLSGEFPEDQFTKSSIAISYAGDRIAVGAPGNRGNGSVDTNDIGHVRVYQLNRITNEWNQLGTDIVGTANFQELGLSVSFNSDGSRLAIGGSGVAAAPTTETIPNGIVRVYRFDIPTQNWVQIGADILGNTGLGGTETQTYFGYSVALNEVGNRLVVGCPGRSFRRGNVRVFQLNAAGTAWTLYGNVIQRMSPDVNDYFGASVAMTSVGNVIAVGIPQYAPFFLANTVAGDNNNPDPSLEIENFDAYNYGVVQLYRYDATNNVWNEYYTLFGKDMNITGSFPSTGPYGRMFGHSLAFDKEGTTLAVGAPRFTQTRLSNSNISSTVGAVGIYDWYSNSLDDLYALGLTPRKVILIGDDRYASNENLPTRADRGFGTSVSLNHNGSILAVGYPDAPSITGAYSKRGLVKLYKKNTKVYPVTWVPMGKTIESPIDQVQYKFGNSCALAPNSTMLSIQALKDLNGDPNVRRGYTHAFQLTSKKFSFINPVSPPLDSLTYRWVESSYNKSFASLTNMTLSADNDLGYSVSMSDDGNVIAFGSPNANSNKGRVDIFAYRSNGTTVEWTKAGTLSTAVGDSKWGSNICLSPDGKAIAIAQGNSIASSDKVVLYVNQGNDTYANGSFNDNWQQNGAIINGPLNSNFGVSLALITVYNNNQPSYYRLTIGSNLEDITGKTNCGGIQTYTILPNTPTTTNAVAWPFHPLRGVAPNNNNIEGIAGEKYGQSMAMGNNFLIVGAPGNTNNRGAIYMYVYEFINGVPGWRPLLFTVPRSVYSWQRDYYVGNEGDNFGYSVDCNRAGTYIVVGAPNKNVTTSPIDNYSSGTVRVYNVVARTGSGQFDSISTITQIGPDIKGERIGDCFGTKVSISEDGQTVLIYSEPKQPTNSTRNNYIEIYKYDSKENIWVSVLKSLNAQLFGTKGASIGPFTENNPIKLSKNGKRFITGDYNSSITTTNIFGQISTIYGACKTYELENPTLSPTGFVYTPPPGSFIGPPLPP